jgi:hypothetical protein
MAIRSRRYLQPDEITGEELSRRLAAVEIREARLNHNRNVARAIAGITSSLCKAIQVLNKAWLCSTAW